MGFPARPICGTMGPMSARPQRITVADKRASGVHGLLMYCGDHTCSHSPRSAARMAGRRAAVGPGAALPTHGLRQARRRCLARFQLGEEGGRDDGLSMTDWSRAFDDPIALPMAASW